MMPSEQLQLLLVEAANPEVMPWQLLTTAQVAQRLSLAEATIRAWLRAGKLLGVKVGKSWRVPKSELQRIIGSGSVSN